MKRITTLFLAVTATLFLSACGGSSDGADTTPPPSTELPPVEGTPPSIEEPTPPPTTPDNKSNSELSDGQNALGYYGEQVLYGDTTMAGEWLFDLKSVTIGDVTYNFGSEEFYFYNDGTIAGDAGKDFPLVLTYGVSDNKKILKYNDGDAYSNDGINYTAAIIVVEMIQKIDSNCYKITSTGNARELGTQKDITTTGTMCKI